jgi:predicted nucleic acid-binding protein
VAYLLDTNVVSELRKNTPDARVAGWINSLAEGRTYLSSLVVGEIRQGVERKRRKDPPQAEMLDAWLTGLESAYSDRIIPVPRDIAEEWGRMNVPDPVATIDGLLAATAKARGLTLVTRNTADLVRTDVPLLNPFEPLR